MCLTFIAGSLLRGIVWIIIISAGALNLLHAWFGLAAWGRYADECPGGSDCQDAAFVIRLSALLVTLGVLAMSLGVRYLRRCRKPSG